MNKTAQREAILHELRGLTSHPTADDLYALLRPKMPQISLGTVYRNLEQMSQAGIIRKLEIAGKQKRFDGDVSAHHHMRCRECGAVFDLSSDRLAEISDKIRSMLPELQCESFSIEFSGLCPNCCESSQP